MLSWIDRLSGGDWDRRAQSVFGAVTRPKTRAFSLPKPNGPRPFEVVGIPLKGPGFYVVEIESEILGKALLDKPPRPMFVATSALVTNLAVHFKWGVESSLVWVTTLAGAKPVNRATVQIQDCTGKALWQGSTDAGGLARVPRMPAQAALPRCSYSRLETGLLVSATLGDDMAFTHTSWNQGIEPWRFGLPVEWEESLLIAHTVFDRPLFRAGETVHMKHVLRKHVAAGFSLAPVDQAGRRLIIQHSGSAEKYVIPLEWDAAGSAESAWTIPKEAKLGDYQVYIARDEKGEGAKRSGSFRVEEFRIPFMRGLIRPPAGALIAPDSIPLDLTVSYLSGGGAGMLPVKLRYQLEPRTVRFPAFDGFSFAGGKVREGIVRGDDPERTDRKLGSMKTTELTLDDRGSVRTTISGLPKLDAPVSVAAELEYKDPNGETQTVSSTIPLWTAGRVVGIRPDSWTLSQESLKFRVAVADLQGNAVANAPVTVDLYRRQIYSHRKRLTGGFYSYEHSTETRKVQRFCSGTTDRRGLLFCEAPSPVSGNVLLQASTKDSQRERGDCPRRGMDCGKGGLVVPGRRRRPHRSHT
jgi:uncharacterized protein YfaS (alpha-2-macroglobulin family)